MWKVIQQILPALLIVLVITQYVVPIIFNGTTWWLFRPEPKKKNKEITNPSSLSEEIKVTESIVKEAKTKAEIVIEKVEENLKTAEDLKKEADKLK